MKKYLMKLIKAKETQAENLRKSMKEAKTADEVRTLGDTLMAVLDELREAQEQLDALDEEPEDDPVDDDGGDDGSDGSDDSGADDNSSRSGKIVNGQFLRSIGAYQTGALDTRDKDPYGSTEYRKAFKDYVQRGTPIPAKFEKRAAGDPGPTVTGDIGAIIPTTVMEELIKDVSKVYGQVYGKVRKLTIRGGVQFPISRLSANVKWIGETEVSERKKAGDAKEYVTFGYHQAEIRISVSLLAMTVSLELFESEIAKIIAEAYVHEMDSCIVSGTGVGQPLGIVNDSRVTNIVEMTEAEFADWTAWKKKLFSKIPLSKRGQGEFLFTNATMESNLLTMKDQNDRPLFREAADLQIGDRAIDGTFFGRGTTLVEPDILADFDTAVAGDVVGIYWIPTDYAVNTNMEFNVHRYFDEETNQWVTKGIVIVDGKMLDTSGCFIIKKKA